MIFVIYVHQLLETGHLGINDVISQQDGEGFLAYQAVGSQDGISQAQGFSGWAAITAIPMDPILTLPKYSSENHPLHRFSPDTGSDPQQGSSVETHGKCRRANMAMSLSNVPELSSTFILFTLSSPTPAPVMFPMTL